MQRFLASLTCAGLLATALTAQCYETSVGVPAPRGTFQAGTGDDVLFDIQPLGFAFPFGATTYTHAYFNPNGCIYLSNGVAAPLPSATGYSTIAATQLTNLRGATATTAGNGNLPRIAPLWRDLVAVAGTGAVFVNTTIPGKFVVTWGNVRQFGTTTPFYTIQAQLFVNGDITFAYGPGTVTSAATITGVSAAANIAAVAGSDLSAGSATTTDLHFEQFAAGPVDLADQAITFVPVLGGGFTQTAAACPGISVVVPPVASNTSYGTGCYTFAPPPTADSFYEFPATAALGSAAFSGLAWTMTPSLGAYSVTLGGTYVPPTGGATSFVGLTDDGTVITPTLSTPFTFPGGSTSSFWVASNGRVATSAGPSAGFTPSNTTFLNQTRHCWSLWHDFNSIIVGSGLVKFEEVAGIAYITWDGVWNFGGTTAADASTFQFQFDLTTGAVTFVATTLSTLGNRWLCGYSPPGASVDGLSQVLTTLLTSPLQLAQAAVGMSPLTLAASPAPLSSPSSSNSVTFTATNIPEFTPAGGVYVGLHVLSSGQINPGFDLTPDAPGCLLHVLTFDTITIMLGLTSTQTLVVPVPIGLPVGLVAYTQLFGIFTPSTLPNGQNPAGLTTSNGLRHFVSNY